LFFFVSIREIRVTPSLIPTPRCLFLATVQFDRKHTFANGNAHVQAGDTAFSTCSDRESPCTTKSISSFLFLIFNNCARMPGFPQCRKSSSFTPSNSSDASETSRERKYLIVSSAASRLKSNPEKTANRGPEQNLRKFIKLEILESFVLLRQKRWDRRRTNL